MLTRVEIDGFKSFEGFALDLQPFCAVVGPNATGKSNLFDAFRLLSRLAETDVATAVRDLRGEPSELFRVQPDGKPGKRITLAADLLVDREIVDAYGKSHTLKGTRLRYEVGIERRSTRGGSERLYIFREDAKFIKREDDQLFRAHRGEERKAFNQWALAAGKTSKLISTVEDQKTPTIQISQDGGAGRKRTIPLGEASATFLSTVRTADEFPHLYAVRAELASLRFLQLDPAAERMPSDILAEEELRPDGSNLAAVLARIKAETTTRSRPQGLLSDIRADLASMIPGVVDLEVIRNEAARQYQVFVTMRDEARFSSLVLSDGTLRVLALLTLLHDPRRRGVLCFEEPENGIHEARIEGLIELLRDFCTDLSAPPVSGEKLSQIIVNTHSPEVMRHLKDSEIVAADMVLFSHPQSRQSYRKTRMRRGVRGDRLPLPGETDASDGLTRYELDQLLRREPESVR